MTIKPHPSFRGRAPAIVLPGLLAAGLVGLHATAQENATATLHACADGKAIGTASFREQPSTEGIKLVDVEVRVEGSDMAQGAHAVHIHETAACEPCGAAKGHFDPGPP